MIYIFISFIFLLLIFAYLYVKYSKNTLTDTFKALAFDVIEKNNKSFFDLASTYFEKYKEKTTTEIKERQQSIQTALDPIKEGLKKLEEHNKEIEKQRLSAYSVLNKQVESLITSENMLRHETANLTKALKSPNIRGSWGQIHLRRVVELAGMLDNCDFYEQKTITNEDKVYRPDMVVRLPGDRQIIIDAKTPIEAYLESIEINEEKAKKEKLIAHAKHVRKHIKELSNKEYWKQSSSSVEYVILFLPAEAFFSAALQEDPTLLEVGAKENIIIATPSTLIAILRAVAYSWKQEYISQNTKEITALGKQLYERLTVMNNHWHKLGKNLALSIDSYNQAISSLESRVLVSAKKLKEICVSKEEEKTPFLQQITKTTRSLK